MPDWSSALNMNGISYTVYGWNLIQEKDDVSWIDKMNNLQYDCIVQCGEACGGFYRLMPSIIFMALLTVLIK